MKLLAGLIPRSAQRRPSAPVLTDDEVSAAVHHFRTLEPFCEAEPFVSNDGFGASVSFRTSTHRSVGGLGAVEIGLRAAALQFKPPADGSSWSWSEAIAPFVRSHRGIETVQDAGGQKVGGKRSAKNEREVGGQVGGAAFGWRAQGNLALKSGVEAESTVEQSQTWTTTRTLVKPLAEIEGARSPFTLRLTAPDQNNLGFFNADLIRQSFLSAPEPSSMDLASVSVTLRLPVVQAWSGDLIHSLSIQNASGAWAPLIDTRNQQVLSELLISKFLRPLHRPRRLWPLRQKGEK